MATETATPAATATDSGAATDAPTTGSPQDGAPASSEAAPLSRDAIREEHRKALAAGAKPLDDDEEPTPLERPAPAEVDEDVEATPADGDEKPKADAKEDRPVAAIARLSSENRELKAKLKELEGAAKPDGSDSIAALREKVKADPGVLWDMFAEDIGGEADGRLTRFNDSVLERADRDPKLSEQDKRVSKLERELAEERAARQGAETAASTARAKANTARALTEGFKGEDGATLIDAAKFPYVNHLTKVGEADCHAMVTEATSKLVVDFAKEKGRDPTRTEVAELISLAAGKIEAHYAKRAKNYVLPTRGTTETDPDTRARDQRPTTLTKELAGRASDPPKTLTVEEERERIRQEHRRGIRALATA